MRELEIQEIEAVDGGFLQILAAAVLIYTAGDILNDFRKGFNDGSTAAI